MSSLTPTTVEAVSPNQHSVFPNAAAEFVYVRTYARWMEEEGRRETWQETVDRYVNFIYEKHRDRVKPRVYKHIRKAIGLLGVVPSMRALWAAGPAAEFENLCFYNCSFQAINKIEAFRECLYILMCGAGYGFSVEKKYTTQLPVIPNINTENIPQTHIVDDSRKGWADSLDILINSLYEGRDVHMDYSDIRPRGARLVTMGGRASGPDPLICLHAFVRETFFTAQGRQLMPIECHDIINEIGEIVVAGGVRRSSEMSLSDLDDSDMAKSKEWPFPQRRRMANNSAVYDSKPSAVEFLKEWSILASSGTGERGIFNRYAARASAPSRRNSDLIIGVNPCSEINLRSEQLCNLSEVITRVEDDLDMMFKKIETAVWIGAIQSTYTYFPYLNDNWINNCEEERLLGVSITGQMDSPRLFSPDAVRAMKRKAIKTSRHAASVLGINEPTSVTCVKPSGTTSQVTNSSSGMHTRFSQYQIRRYRISSTDPLLSMLQDIGMEASPENGEGPEDWDLADSASERKKDLCSIHVEGEQWSKDKVRTWILSFPIKAPDGCITRNDLSAIEQLEHYKKMQTNWCEHSVSCTVFVKEDEWFDVGNWVLKNWETTSGVAFLPYDGGHYKQAPNEEITKEEYDKMVAEMPEIDYSLLSAYEKEDNTSGAKTYACTGDSCELT